MNTVCNIGPAERRLRRASAIATALLSMGIWFVLFLFQLPWWYGFILLAPVFFSVLNFIQDYQKFCAAYGLAGLINLSNNLLRVEKIDNPELTAYRKRAGEIIQQSGLATMVILVVLLTILAVF